MRVTVLEPTSRIIISPGTASVATVRLGTTRLECGSDNHIFGQYHTAVLPARQSQSLARTVGHVALAQRAADFPALSTEKCIRHCAGDDEDIDLADEKAQQIELGRDLRAADQCQNRPPWRLESRRQRRKLGLHQLAGGIRQQPRQRVDRSVGAVRSREGVVDVNVAEFGKSSRKIGRVRFFLLVEAKVFEEGHLPGLKRGNDTLRVVANAILSKDDFSTANRPAQWRDQGSKRKGEVSRSVRPAKMRHHDDLRAPIEERLDGRRESLNSGRIGDSAVLHRHVQIGTQQHSLAAYVDVVHSSKFGHGALTFASGLAAGGSTGLAKPAQIRRHFTYAH